MSAVEFQTKIAPPLEAALVRKVQLAITGEELSIKIPPPLAAEL